MTAGGEYPSGGDEGVCQPLGWPVGGVGVAEPEGADGDEQVEGVGEGVDGRYRAAGQLMRVVDGIDGDEQDGEPDRGEPGPVSVADGRVEQTARDTAGGGEGRSLVPLLGEQDAADVVVVSGAPVVGGELLVGLRLVSEGVAADPSRFARRRGRVRG